MPHVKKITPNLVVSEVERTAAFYRDALGFSVAATVPEQPPYVFAVVQAGSVEIYLNAPEAAFEEYPALKSHPLGGTLTLFLEVEDIGALHEALKEKVPFVRPLERKWYGVTEFAIADPNGYIITFAQREG